MKNNDDYNEYNDDTLFAQTKLYPENTLLAYSVQRFKEIKRQYEDCLKIIEQQKITANRKGYQNTAKLYEFITRFVKLSSSNKTKFRKEAYVKILVSKIEGLEAEIVRLKNLKK